MGSSGRFKFSGITQKSNAASDAAQNKVVRMKTNAKVSGGATETMKAAEREPVRWSDLLCGF